MIFRIERHAKQPDLIVIHAGPETGAVMGGFQPARWQEKSRAYWMPAEHLDAFIRYVDLKGGTFVDERSTGGALGPLPECRRCGQAAKRGAEARYCADCGAPWEPVVHASGLGDDAARATCPHCGRTQRGNFQRCQNCGQLMPVREVAVIRPLIPARPRHVLDEPVAFGDVIDGSDPDGQLPLTPTSAQEATP